METHQMPSSVINLATLREEALDKIRDEGHVPFSNLDGAYIGYLIYQTTKDEDHVLFSEAEYEIDCLNVGKWEFLWSWLYPGHTAAQSPILLGEIAMYLLGRKKMPPEIKRELQAELGRQ